MKLSFEEKLNIAALIKEGCPLKSFSKTRHLNHRMVEIWRARYEKYGEKGFVSGQRLIAMRQKKRGNCARTSWKKRFFVSAKHKIRSEYLNHKGLGNQSPRSGYNACACSRNELVLPQTELEKLESWECAAKKAKALVEKQQPRARLNGQKPSTNWVRNIHLAFI